MCIRDSLHKLGAATREIRVKEEVAGVDGLIFPGGESTAMVTFQCTNQFRGDSCTTSSTQVTAGFTHRRS